MAADSVQQVDPYNKIRNYASGAIAVLAVLFVLIVQPTYMVLEELQLRVFLSCALAIIFLKFPLKFINVRFPALSFGLDCLLALLSFTIGVYFIQVFDRILLNPSMPTALDQMIAVIAVLLVLEATRRSVNLALVIIAVIFILYGFYGYVLPSLISSRGYELDRMTSVLYLTQQGLFGIPLKVMLRYIVLFIVFGNLLEVTGGSKFFIDFARSIAGRLTGGMAKVAIISSGFMGSISGSAVANVATTGCITIPAMKKGKYDPHWAGAVEAVASTGGQILPPIMGAAAFIMAEFLAIPYTHVIVAAAIPALLFYASVLTTIHFYASKNGLKGERKEDLPTMFGTLRAKGFFLIPLVVIVIAFVMGYSPTTAGLWGVFATIIVTSFYKESRLSLTKIIEALKKAGLSIAALTCTGAAAGIIIGMVTMTGLGAKLSSILVTLAGGNLLILLIITAITSIILGMGVPTTVAYILLATLVTSALVDMGVVPIVAHLFIFYFGILSMVTPPVALAAYAAAAIADSNADKTGWTAFRLAIPGFIIPFFIIYSPALAFQGDFLTITWAVITSVVGVMALSVAIIGYFRTDANVVERAAFGLGAVMLIFAGITTDIIGFTILFAAVLYQIRKGSKSQIITS